VAKLVAQQAELGVVTADKAELDRITRNALRIDDVIYAVIVSPSGATLSSAHKPGVAWSGPKPGSRGAGNTVYEDFVDAAAVIVPSEFRGVVDWDSPRDKVSAPGIVHVGISSAAQQDRLRTTLVTVLLVSLVGLTALAVMLRLQRWKVRTLLAPLKDLISFTKLLAAGELTQRTAVVRDDEVGQLAKAANEMAERLENARRELMDAVEKAKEASRLKSEFLANMSHEIRTPLNGVLGMIELALEGEIGGEQRDYLCTATTSAHSLLVILNDILDFSKIEAGRLELSRNSFDLASQIDHIGKAYAARAYQKGLELTCRIAPGIPSALVGDADRLRQVLQNLLSNAIKFTETGEVFLNVTAIDAKAPSDVLLQFEVHDSGIGIPEAKQKYIFEAFRQADGSTTRLYGGTGLGLAICTRLVGLMGGTLTVESTPGAGSRFRFTVGFQRDALPAVALEAAPVAGLRVLLMATNENSFSVLEEALTCWQADVTRLPAGGIPMAAVSRTSLECQPFHLLIVDRHLDGLDGFAVAEQFIGESPVVSAAIVMTTVADQGSAARCQALRGVEHITKPISPKDLRLAITRAFGRDAGGRVSAPSAPELSRGALSPNPMHVLLVEDNAVNQKLARRLLERAGHRVEAAWDGMQALQLLAAGAFDCVLMDVQMPHMDGLDTTRALRRLEEGTGRHIPIVAMTAHALDGDRERCLEAGMDAYMTKPISRNVLLDILHAVSSPPDDSSGGPILSASSPSSVAAGTQIRPNQYPGL
jgi:signal transduction histidine kinase/DNA-binding response OmpR family regulator